MLHFNWEVLSLNYHFGPVFRALHWCTDQHLTTALGKMDLTASQGQIMSFIVRRQQPPCARDIEEHFRLSHPSVSGTLSRLEKKGFIEFRPDANDRRCKRIHPLPRGLQCHQRMIEEICSIEHRITADFTPEEQEVFHTLLIRALTNLGGTPCCPPTKEEPNP